MAFFFVYKSPFGYPSGKYTLRIEEDSILKWFQKIWRDDLGEMALFEYYKRTLGTYFYGLAHFVALGIENKATCPNSFKELIKFIQENTYLNTINYVIDQYIEVLTDDDEVELAWYLIDEQYAQSNASRFKYLVTKDWPLPLDYSNKGMGQLPFDFKQEIRNQSKGEGVVYMITICCTYGLTIDDTPIKIEGLRLPSLARYLLEDKLLCEDLPTELLFIKSQLNELESPLAGELINQLPRFAHKFPLLHRRIMNT